MNAAHPSLTGVPPETLDKIFKTLDYKEILRPRPVCKHLKNFVDNYRPDFHHKYIVVNVITNGFFVLFGNNLRELDRKNHMKKVMSVVGDEDMWGPLETVLAHQKSPLEVFHLNCELEENEKVFLRLLEKIQTILTSQNRLFQVKCFSIHAQNEDQVMRVLPHLDPDVIQSINLVDMLPLSLRREKKPMGIQKIKESIQFKRASGFGARNFFTNSKLEEFEHFDRISITVPTLKMSEVNMFKEKIFASPINKLVAIAYLSFEKDAEIPEGHLPMTDSNSYRYPIPNQNKYVVLRMYEKHVDIEICENVHIDGEDAPFGMVELDSDDEW